MIGTPGSFKATGAQQRKLFPASYWQKSLGYGMQYYIAARFAVAVGHIPVAANLAHHALEVMLKASAEGATKEQILKFGHKHGGFGHSLKSESARPLSEVYRNAAFVGATIAADSTPRSRQRP